MKFTLSWLKKYLDTDATAEQIIDALTTLGLEVEEVVNQAEIYKDFIIAEIISAVPHPEADKLKVCQVNNGQTILQIICGAPNARAGIKVVLAPIGTAIPANGMRIKESKIRNMLSCGMLCSGAELNLTDDSTGIMELDAQYLIGHSFAQAHGLNELMIEVAITPNRGDCLGIYGIARDLAAAGYGVLKPLTYHHIIGEFTSPIKVQVNSSHCLRYIGRYFKNVSNNDSPDWLQKDLKSIGLTPISALVDITNYMTFAFGRPLHVFDADLIHNIEVRDGVAAEAFTALNDKRYQCKGGELVIADGTKLLGLAGIIGEKTSGVSKNTKNIFLEIGLFDADAIAKASRLHQIDTDAKFRFERKVDPGFMREALALATEMITQICGGEVSQEIDIDHLHYTPKEINFPLSELKKRLGIEYDKKLVSDILLKLGFAVTDREDILTIIVPSWRQDISLKEDIVEEIARIDGYDKITATPLPTKNNIVPILDLRQRSHYKISRFAASLGLNEVVTYSFMHAQKAQLFAELKDELYLKNPISNELNYMRPSILPNLLEVAEKNQNRGINNIAIFEFASIFQGIKPEQQVLTMTGLRAGMNHERNIYKDQRIVDIFDAKADIMAILAEMGLDPSKVQYITHDLPIYYHPGRAAALTLGKNIIGYFGELHPKIIKHYDLNHIAVGFELFVDNVPLMKSKSGKKGNLQISDYQAVERDFAFIVDTGTSADVIMRSIAQADKKLIKNINIFDIYVGKGIEEGKKSVACSVVIQALDHTLSEQEIEQICKNIVELVIKNTKGSLRSA